MDEKRASIAIELALCAPRPRERTAGIEDDGSGPMISSRGSDSDLESR